MTCGAERTGRLPASLLAETRAAMMANPSSHRRAFLGSYYVEHRPTIVGRLIADGMDSARAYSRADLETRRLAKAKVPRLERFGAGDPELVERSARDEFDRVRRLFHGTHTDRRVALGRLRDWGVLRTTIKEADRRHRSRAARRAPHDLREAQQRIIRDEVPTWQWPAVDPMAPGLRGLVETNRNGAIHIWTIVADEPLAGAGGRFLDALPRNARIRVFGVTRGSLMEAMLRRRGFAWSWYAWHGLRQGDHASAPAWTRLYR